MNAKIKKLLSYYAPHKKDFFLNIAFAVTWSLSLISIPLILRHAIDEIFQLEKSQAYKMALIYFGLLFAIFIIIFICNRHMKNQGRVLAAKIEADMKVEIFNHFQRLSPGFYNENKIGKLITSITNDADNLSVLFKEMPEIILDFIIRSLGSTVILFFLNTVLGIILATFFVLLTIFIILFSPKVQNSYLPVREIISIANSELEENLSGIKTIQSFTNERLEIQKFANTMEKTVEYKKRLHSVLSIFDSLMLTAFLGITPLIVIVLMFFVLDGSLQINDVITFMLYGEVATGPMVAAIWLVEQLHNNLSAFHRVFEFLQIKPEIIDSSKNINLSDVKGEIEFKDVSFSYKEDKRIFENLNLKIKSNEYIAFVGSSGEGKSTLCNLIPRFYDVTSGGIYIDGINVKDIKLESLRKCIGFVHQDTFLFSGTVMDNIRYGRLSATDQEIFDAARQAHAHDFIMGFSEGYKTQIGPKGLKLSGGQKQRLAIARAILKNPKILIFDEATSNLDMESEKFVQESMKEFFKNRTTIVIAHRLSTIRNAKRILVLSNGKIAEEGTHNELISQNGAYAKFYESL